MDGRIISMSLRMCVAAVLMQATVAMISCGGGGGGGGGAGPDLVSPTPGNGGVIAVTGVSHNLPSLTLTLEWTKGTDNTTVPTALRYRVFRSDSANLNDPDTIDINGTEISTGWTVDIDRCAACGLNPSLDYYFNVLLKDESGNYDIYDMTQLPALSAIEYWVKTDTDNASVTVNGTVMVEGRIRVNGITDSADNDDQILAQVGYGAEGSCPSNNWTWINAMYDHWDGGDHYIYRGNMSPLQVDDYSFCFRFSLDNGATWFYADTDGGQEDKTYDTMKQGALTVLEIDTVKPVPGNGGTLEFTGISRNLPQRAFTLVWTKGLDDTTAQPALRYRVFSSATNNLNDEDTIETNGTEITSGWVTDIDTLSVLNPDHTTDYYFNVLIRDGNDNRKVYTAAKISALGSVSLWGQTVTSSVITTVNVETGTIEAQVWYSGIVQPPNTGAPLVQLGYGPSGSCPSNSWTWKNAAYTGLNGNNLIYATTLTVSLAGTYSYCFRFSRDNGLSWFYGDTSGSSENESDYYNISYQGVLTVNPE